MPIRLLVLGRSGQLARALAEFARPGELDIVALGRPELDLGRPDGVAAAVAAHRPDAIVNAAAYTAVDRAEREPDLAFAVNRDGAAAVARVAARSGLPLLHLSTDYVFDGSARRPYRETDRVRPLNVYGRSKAEGEEAVLSTHRQAVVVRTSWVYAPYGGNFVRSMLRLAGERQELEVVTDQQGRPTYAPHLAEGLAGMALRLVRDGGSGGRYHLAGEGVTSWYGFARAILDGSARCSGPTAPLRPTTTEAFRARNPQAVARPLYSVLDTSRTQAVFGVGLPPWQAGLDACLDRLLGAPKAEAAEPKAESR